MNFIIFGGFQKNELGYESFVDIFWGHRKKLEYTEGSFLCILGYFLKVKVQNGGFFWVAKISNMFWGCLKFLIYFFFLGGGGEREMLGPSLRMNKKYKVPPPPPPVTW